MPTYDYICDSCEHEFEEFQPITAAPLKKCPACKKSKLRRKIGAGAGIIFKGSGFYETDYRSEGYKKSEKAEKEPAATASEGAKDSSDKGEKKADAKSDAAPAKAETKAEAKPAAKSESKPSGGKGKKASSST